MSAPKLAVGQSAGLGKGELFRYFKLVNPTTVEVSEWRGYDVQRTANISLALARARWAQLVREGFTTAEPVADGLPARVACPTCEGDGLMPNSQLCPCTDCGGEGHVSPAHAERINDQRASDEQQAAAERRVDC